MGNVSYVVDRYPNEDDNTNRLNDSKGPIIKFDHCHHLNNNSGDRKCCKNTYSDVHCRDKEHYKGKHKTGGNSLLSITNYDFTELHPRENIECTYITLKSWSTFYIKIFNKFLHFISKLFLVRLIKKIESLVFKCHLVED